ncbi:gluconokinase [Bifidobacterium xylocopae]|uniref:Gluconokinase n=1 Tax=Bifidobacterium xylocopae TaxID=2493119 RepID=A0A366KDM4_9BIFI|nr:gluconokinase [Bifidobacterium xylocopae]RBP99487.1 carbohydrate kinase [Bifidobacterium xylocopae]
MADTHSQDEAGGTPTSIPQAAENTVPGDYLHGKTPVLVIMGVSGCGKTTMNEHLSAKLGWDTAEADDFHPKANIEKMAHGIPLDDDDRWPWLDRIHDWIADHIEQGRPGTVTCSALKRIYRDKLRMPGVIFIHLNGDYDTIMERLSGRKGHFMKPDMLKSQFDTLEPLGPDEIHMTIDVSLKASPETEAEEVIDTLGLECAVETHTEAVERERARQAAHTDSSSAHMTEGNER